MSLMTETFDADLIFMHRAIVQSDRARVLAPPNPWVGCVIVKEGQVVGEGFTQPPGKEHAEAMALKEAGEKAKGSTVYVTLEPCAHFGRTPPCVNALIQAQVSRVVIGIQDPDSNVQGKGIKLLREAGIDVKEGICSKEIAAFLNPYIHHRKTGRPFCIVKAGISIDGKIAASDGTSQWITSAAARQDVHFLRTESQAVIIGAGTALADRPRLTIRDVYPLPRQQPLRVLLDARGRVPADIPLFDIQLGPTIVMTTSLCPSARLEEWRKAGAEVKILPPSPTQNGVDLHSSLIYLGSLGVVQALFEGGGTLIGSLWKSGFVDQLTTYVGPCILGEGGLPLFKGLNISTILEAPRLKLKLVKQIHDCVRLDYIPDGLANDEKI